MDYLAIILITLVSGALGTGLGGLIGVILRRDSHKFISTLLAFAAGVMLAVVCFDLMRQPLEMMRAGDMPSYTPVLTALFTVIGYAAVSLIGRLLSGYTCRKERGNADSLFVTGLVMTIAIAMHNLPEGMVIGVSYAAASGASLKIFSGSGIVMAAVIGLHNIPEGMAISVPLVSGGMGRAKAVLLTASSGLPTVFGAVLGYAIGNINGIMLTLSLGFASGAMLYVVLANLLPKSIETAERKTMPPGVLTGLLVGFLLVAF